MLEPASTCREYIRHLVGKAGVGLLLLPVLSHMDDAAHAIRFYPLGMLIPGNENSQFWIGNSWTRLGPVQ